jgi:C4-dicarboxylate transporter DctM subunit
MSMSLVLLISFTVLVFLGVPISVAIGSGACIAIMIVKPFLIAMIPSMMYGALDSFLLTAIPLFMLAGLVMEKGGTSQRIFDFASSLVGWMPGGLGAVNILASVIFGGISGSSVADAAGLGPIEISAMTKRGYPIGYSAAVTLASSTFSVVIPPSILMVLYAITAGQSVSACLIAGLVPGLTLDLIMIGFNYVISRKNGWGGDVPFRFRTIGSEFKKSFFALLTPIVLLWGVLGGVFTPTEAAAVAVLYVLLISLFIYREVGILDLPKILKEVVRTGGPAVFIVTTASIAAYILTVDKVPVVVAKFLITYLKAPWLIILAICAFLLIVGMFMDASCSIIVLTPLFLPVIMKIGMDPVHFGVMLVVALAIGLVTPPVGACLFVTCAVSKVKLEQIVVELIPFLASLIIGLLVVAYVPQLSLALPKLLGLMR